MTPSRTWETIAENLGVCGNDLKHISIFEVVSLQLVGSNHRKSPQGIDAIVHVVDQNKAPGAKSGGWSQKRRFKGNQDIQPPQATTVFL